MTLSAVSGARIASSRRFVVRIKSRSRAKDGCCGRLGDVVNARELLIEAKEILERLGNAGAGGCAPPQPK